MNESNIKLCPKGHFARTGIEVRLSPVHRYGVFATKDIAPGEVIEECPVIVFRSLMFECRKEISDRTFFWNDNTSAIVLGYGSIYNHAEEKNATYSVDRARQVMSFVATKAIPAGAEILIYYGDNWFGSRARNQAIEVDQKKRSNNMGIFKVTALLFTLFILSQIFPVHF